MELQKKEWRDYDKMRSFFVSDMKIEQERASKIHFSNGQRLPTETDSVGPKPVIMMFACYEDRELILSKAYNLGGSSKRILTNLPVQMKKRETKLSKNSL